MPFLMTAGGSILGVIGQTVKCGCSPAAFTKYLDSCLKVLVSTDQWKEIKETLPCCFCASFSFTLKALGFRIVLDRFFIALPILYYILTRFSVPDTLYNGTAQIALKAYCNVS